MEIIKNFKNIEDYGRSGHFPVYGGKMQPGTRMFLNKNEVEII